MVQNFEHPASMPTVGAPPGGSASVSLSKDHPADGTVQSLKLSYDFEIAGQYLVVEVPVSIKAPIHKLRLMIYGDNSNSGYGLYITDGSGETHKYRSADTMKVNFSGWKPIEFDLDAPHEAWGGDKNNKIDPPVTQIGFEISPPNQGKDKAKGDIYFAAISVDSDKSEVETLGGNISVVSPEYCSDIKGDTKIEVSGPGYKTLTATCWKQGDGFGERSTVATVKLDDQGKGSFVFPADSFPHGPALIRITGSNSPAMWDICNLQLYNKGGVSWKEGLPKETPPGAEGMHVVFADDFSGPLSITGKDDVKAVYYDHKPPHGWQDFSSIPFADYDSPKNPFTQVDTYLRIRADANKNSAGLISSENDNATGFAVTPPCYFECRFIGPDVEGSWPAFWLLSDSIIDMKAGKDMNKVAVDELDIIEAVGGEGPREPNATGEDKLADLYQITPHAWNQGDAMAALSGKMHEDMPNPADMGKHGIPSAWWESMHTYGCKITSTDTIYYCDNIEMGRHKTLPVSQTAYFYFLINLATGGGWPVDLSRYHGVMDMYVDYVRVYAGDGAKVRGGQ